MYYISINTNAKQEIAMSIMRRCDICGKNETQKGCKFSEEVLKLKIPNHKGEIFNVYCAIRIEQEDDSELLDKLYNINKMPEITTAEISGFSDNEEEEQMQLEELLFGKIMNKLQAEPMAISMKLKHPNPLICDSCKKELLKLSIAYGKRKDYGVI